MKRNLHHGERVRAADHALHAYTIASGVEDDDTLMHDLIADLGHYAVRHEIDFLDCAARAIGCWALEQRTDATDDGIPAVVIHIADGDKQ